MNDAEDWQVAHPDDLWILDKLILSKKLGYVCGPKGVAVPKPGRYIVRPCSNFMGMGLGTVCTLIQESTDDIGNYGTFWCEVFMGRHLSIDYYKGRQVLCVEGFRRRPLTNFTRWSSWRKTNDMISLPKILMSLKGDYDWINVEYIGGRIIEVHFRSNPDFRDHNSEYVIPVWKGEKVSPNESQDFIFNSDGERLGFYIEKNSIK